MKILQAQNGCLCLASFLLFIQKQGPQTAAEFVGILHLAAEFLHRRVLLNEALLSVHDNAHASTFLFEFSDAVFSSKETRAISC